MGRPGPDPVWSHLAAMVFVQLAHAFSLNAVCDGLRLKRRAVAGSGVTPPARNTLSHASKGRTTDFAPAVFWRTVARFQSHGLGRRQGVRSQQTALRELPGELPEWAG